MQNTRNLKQSRKNWLIMLVEATKIDLINHALQLLPKVEGILLPFSKIIRDSYKKRNEKSKKTFQKYFPRPPRKSNKNDKSPRLTSNLKHTNPVTKNIFKSRLKAAFTRQTNHFLSNFLFLVGQKTTNEKETLQILKARNPLFDKTI